MAGEIDILILEKQIGKEFSGKIKKNLLASIRTNVSSRSGLALKSKTRANYSKDGYLHSLTMTLPYYIFPILNFGYEGSKSQSLNYRVKARNFISEALEGGRLVEDLASKIGNNRASAVIGRIDAILFDKKTVDNVLADFQDE